MTTSIKGSLKNQTYKQTYKNVKKIIKIQDLITDSFAYATLCLVVLGIHNLKIKGIFKMYRFFCIEYTVATLS